MVVGALTCLALVVQIVCGHNLDHGTATVIHGNNTGSLFGYSVAMWTEDGGGGDGGADSGGRVLIGAPKYRKDLGQEGERVPPTMGQLNICQPPNYSCHHHDHANLPFISRSLKPELLWNTAAAAINSIKFTKTLNIGFPETLTTLSIGASPTIVACAPRYPLVAALISGGYSTHPGGACYIITGSLFKGPSLVVPFSGLYKFPNGTNLVNDIRFTGSSLAGFSVAASTQNQALYVGGPYAYVGQGIVSQLGHKVNSRLEAGEEELDYQGEGWAVVVGRFGGSQEVVAASAPDALNLFGKVTFYNLVLEPLGVSLEGPEYAAKFGYSLSVGDLDGDGTTDLVVGAPMASGGEVGRGDRGKVYVYYAPTSKTSPPRPPQELVPPEGGREGGNFGLALTTVDLDQDGYQDLVVGEPGGVGAVYVYSGGDGGLFRTHRQAIYPSSLPSSASLLGFGWSLASGTDLDLNGYPDLLLGAPHNDKAVVIRSSPVVWLRGEVRFIPEVISLMERSCQVEWEPVVCFDLQLTLSYHTKRPLGELELVLEVSVDPEEGRAAFINTTQPVLTETRIVNSDQVPAQPWTVTAYIKTERPRLETPLTVSVRAFLPQRPSTPLSPTPLSPEVLSPGVLPPPVLAPGGSLISGTGTGTLSCPTDGICLTKADLILTVDGPSEVIIGEGDVHILVGVQVQQNTAYMVHLSLGHSEHLTFDRVSGDGLIPLCDTGSGQLDQDDLRVLKCNLTADLLQNSETLVTFHFSYSVPTLLDYINTPDNTSSDMTSPDATSSSSSTPDMTWPNLTSDNQTPPDLTFSDLNTPDTTFSDLNTTDPTFSDLNTTDLNTADTTTLDDLTPSDTTSPKLTFHIEVGSDTPDLAPEDNVQTLTLPLRALVDLQLTGQSQPDNVNGQLNQSASLKEMTVGATLPSPTYLGPPLTHTFTLTNLGPSPLTPTKLDLQLPLQLSDGWPLLYPLVPLLIRGPISCPPIMLNPMDFKFSSFRPKENEIIDNGEVTDENGTLANSSFSTTPLTPLADTFSEDDTPTTNATMAEPVTFTSDPLVAAPLQIFGDRSSDRHRQGSATVDCNILPCYTITCEVDWMEPGETVSVAVSGYLVLAAVKHVSERNYVGFSSQVKVLVNGSGYHQPDLTSTATTQVIITAQQEKRSVVGALLRLPWWCWLVVGAASILLLIVLGIALYKGGFFERDRVMMAGMKEKSMVRTTSVMKKEGQIKE